MNYLDTYSMRNLSKEAQLAYLKGILNGVTSFAWWKDGTQYVGTCGTRLSEVVVTVEKRIKEVEEMK